MKTPRTTLRPALVGALTWVVSTPLWAHGGHGLAGTAHWHATDALGCLLVAALASAAWWLGGRQ